MEIQNIFSDIKQIVKQCHKIVFTFEFFITHLLKVRATKGRRDLARLIIYLIVSLYIK